MNTLFPVFFRRDTRLLRTRTRLYTDDHTLTLADIEPFWSHRMNSAGDKTFDLPAIIQAIDGRRVTMVKANTGKVSLQPAGGNKIADGSAGAAAYNDEASEIEAIVTLEACYATLTWLIFAASGTWTVAGLGPLADYFAVVSLGAFPTPTPTSAQRAYLAASYGLRKEL